MRVSIITPMYRRFDSALPNQEPVEGKDTECHGWKTQACLEQCWAEPSQPSGQAASRAIPNPYNSSVQFLAPAGAFQVLRFAP